MKNIYDRSRMSIKCNGVDFEAELTGDDDILIMLYSLLGKKVSDKTGCPLDVLAQNVAGAEAVSAAASLASRLYRMVRETVSPRAEGPAQSKVVHLDFTQV